jgi:hypothetical protein
MVRRLWCGLGLALMVACGGSGGGDVGRQPTPVDVGQLVGSWRGAWQGRDVAHGSLLTSGEVTIRVWYDVHAIGPYFAMATVYGVDQFDSMPIAIDGAGYRFGPGMSTGGAHTLACEFGHYEDPRELIGTLDVRTQFGEARLTDCTFRATQTSTGTVRIVDRWEQGGYTVVRDVTYEAR